MNEDDLILKYDKINKALYTSSIAPVRVENKALQYEVAFDIIDFEIDFRYVDIENKVFNIQKVMISGTTFYKDMKDAGKTKTIKNRDKAYKGSIQHFMRSLYGLTLEDEGFIFGKKGFKVNWFDFFTIGDIDINGYKNNYIKR